MKKLLALSICFLFLAGCSKPATTEVKKEDKIYSVGEEGQIGRASITVKKVEKSQGDKIEKPKDGMEFIIVTIHEKNIGQSNITYTPYYYKMENSKGQVTDNKYTVFNKNTFGKGELVPGGEVDGDLVFEVPKDDNKLILYFSPEGSPLLKFKLK